MFDGKAFGQEMVGIVKAHVERVVAPLTNRITELEKQLASMPAPKDGKDANVDEVAALAAASILPDIMEVRRMVDAMPAMPDVPALIAEAIAAMPVPKNGEPGKSVTLEDVVPLISSEVEKAVAAIPPAKDGQDGKSIDEEAFKEFFKAHIGEQVSFAIAAMPPAEKGKDADPEAIAALVRQEVERAVAALPVPENGKSVTVEDVRPLIEAEVTKAFTGIPIPKDGIDAMDVMVDREGNLVFTMSDGRMKNVGLVVGKDGERGRDGSNGAPGKDGADGVGFDDLDLVETENGVFLRFTRGDVVKDFRLPIVTDHGVFKEGSTYRKGDGVTWGGSFWIAQDETSEKPDGGKGWRLAVKKGRDGKDGIMKPAPKPGPVKVS